MVDTTTKLRFPRIVRVTLTRFSLFNITPTVTIDFNEGVFCLAGANGLGKSTFLSALNYGLTGIVSDPERIFSSVDEYFKHSISQGFSREYFKGRISERDLKHADVTIEMLVNGQIYEITRSVWDGAELKAFTIRDLSRKRILFDTKGRSPADRQDEYATRIVADLGVAGYEQFVFLQHFILTFDERRHPLFWAKKPLEQAMYLAFGVSLAQAKRADKLRTEADGADSLARNFNWQATEVRKRIQDLEGSLKSGASPGDDIVAEHQGLTTAIEASQKRITRLEGEQRDANLKLATLSAEHTALRAEYSKEVAKRVNGRPPIAQHPLIVRSRVDSTCGLCGAVGPSIPGEIEAHISGKHCPICASEVSKSSKPREVERLQKLDKSLVATRKQLDEAVQLVGRIANELEAAREGEQLAAKLLADFEAENAQFRQHLRMGAATSSLSSVLGTYQSQMDDFLNRKREQYQRRDDKRRELRKLQEVLAKRYKAAEVEFVPLFRELAFRFIGLELDIRMEATQPNPHIALLIELKGSTRRDFHQLSESQRFFIDIALRMALAQYMSDPSSKATLFIDTPEGSLDIAYESRAGDMLAMFAGRGFPIIMTANINSSRLLISLAKKLGRSGMVLNRMTSWAELSEVQSAAEGLFREAYEAIERSFTSGKRRAS